jgi:hypothetical protein
MFSIIPTTNRTVKKVIIIANDGDACGKSTLTALISDHLTRKSLRHKLVLTSMSQETPMDSTLMDVEEGFKGEEFINLVDSTDVLLVEVHSGGAEQFEKRFFKQRLDDALDEIECAVTLVLPVCNDEYVVQSALERARAMSKVAELVVVRMPLAADIPLNYETSTARRVINQFGATEITMPALKDSILDELDNMELDVPLALTQRQHLPRFVRHEMLAWEVNFAETMRVLDPLLIPDRSRKEDVREESIYGKTLSF